MSRLAAALLTLHLWIGIAAAEQVRIGLAFNADGLSERAVRSLRDGFELGLRHVGPAPGGHDLSLAFMPPGEGPESARLDAFVKADAPRFLVTAVPRSDPMAQLKAFSDAGVIVLRAVAGGAELAGKRCLANVFVTHMQAEQPLDAIARYVENATQKRSVVLYSTAMEGAAELLRRSNVFLRFSAVADESPSYESDIDRLLLDQPQRLVLVAKAATATAVLKALRERPAGRDIEVISTALAEESNIQTFGELAVGVAAPGFWATGIDTKTNADFVASFEQSFGHPPTSYAVAGYDAAQLIGLALARAKAPLSAAGLREVIRSAQIQSPRGTLAFSNNNFPIQDIYIKRIEQLGAGELRSATVSKVFAQFGDDFAAECPLR